MFPLLDTLVAVYEIGQFTLCHERRGCSQEARGQPTVATPRA